MKHIPNDKISWSKYNTYLLNKSQNQLLDMLDWKVFAKANFDAVKLPQHLLVI